jgi:hypothetical protein
MKSPVQFPWFRSRPFSSLFCGGSGQNEDHAKGRHTSKKQAIDSWKSGPWASHELENLSITPEKANLFYQNHNHLVRREKARPGKNSA